VLLQAALGLRVSELLGVHVAAVDFLRRRVSIERQLGRGGQAFAPLKTEHSRRTLSLARDLVHVLSEYPNTHGVLLTTEHGNPVRQDLYTARIFRAAVAKAGLPEGTIPHDLRHHVASVLLAQRVPVNVVADRVPARRSARRRQDPARLSPASHFG